MKFIKIILSLVIIFTAYVGDHIVFKSRYSDSFVFRAVADSILHGSLGFISSIMFFSHENQLNPQACVFNILFCTFISSLIDIDHLFVAKSFNLKVATLINLKHLIMGNNVQNMNEVYLDFWSNCCLPHREERQSPDLSNLKERGIFHCTTFWLLLTTLLLMYSYLQKKLNIYILTFMLILAFTSHHIRDANRRGLWVYPFGHTPPIDKSIYIFLLSVLPHAIAYFYFMFKGDFTKNVYVDYTMVV